jgi:hypothetical protein
MIWNDYHFLKQNIEIKENHDTFKFSYLLKNDEEKINVIIWTTIIIYYNKFHRKMFQNSFKWKKMGKKT